MNQEIKVFTEARATHLVAELTKLMNEGMHINVVARLSPINTLDHSADWLVIYESASPDRLKVAWPDTAWPEAIGQNLDVKV